MELEISIENYPYLRILMDRWNMTEQETIREVIRRAEPESGIKEKSINR